MIAAAAWTTRAMAAARIGARGAALRGAVRPGAARPGARALWAGSRRGDGMTRWSAHKQLLQRGTPGAARGLFIQTEETPNPSSLKFLPGKEVLPEEFGSAMDFRAGDSASHAPLARLLLRVQGVDGVFLGNDFITVSKQDSLSWAQLKPEIFATVMDFYATGKPAVTGAAEEGAGDAAGDDSEIVLLIKELLEERIRPMVHEDGGDIFFKGFDEDTGIVQVQLAGSCSGCPSSTVTLKSGVENMLMHYLPEVKGVQAVGEMDMEPDARKLTFNPST